MTIVRALAVGSVASILLMGGSTIAGPYVDAVLLDNPVGYWRLEEGSGTAVDSSPLSGSQDGTYLGDPVTTIPGPIQNESENVAVSFNGNQGYIEVPDPSGLLGTPVLENPWTIELWWLNETSEPGGANNPVAKGAHPSVTFFNRASPNSGFGILSGGGIVNFSDPVPGAWTHVVGVLSTAGNDPFAFDTDLRVYVNGNLVVDETVSGLPDDNPDTTTESLSIGGLLFDDPGTVIANFFDGAVDEVAIYNYALDDPNETGARDNTRILAHYNAAGAPPPPPLGTWVSSNSGNWNNAINWFEGSLPNSNSAAAIFGDFIDQPRTIFTETAVTVKSITFNSANEYVIMGNGNITLDSDTGTASIDVQNGEHQMQLPVTLATTTNVTTAAGTSLTFNNTLDLGGNDLNESGPGTLIFNSNVITGGGNVTLSGGFLGGSGSIDGDVTVSSGGLALLKLSDGEFNGLAIAGTATLEGTLAISLAEDYVPQDGDTFQVLTASSIDAEGLTLPGDIGFRLNVVYDVLGGQALQLSFTAVPEPATAILACLAMLGCCILRKRAIHTAIGAVVVAVLTGGFSPSVHAGPYIDAVLADNPVGYWRLEEGTGVAGDTANAAGPQGGAQDGMYRGDAPQVAGPILTEPSNLALNINVNGDPSDIVSVPDSPAGVIGSTQSFTFETWVNPVDLGGGPRIILHRGFFDVADTPPLVGGDFLGQFSPNFRFAPNGWGTDGTIDIPGVTPGVWTHLVATTEHLGAGQSQLKVYVNGIFTAAVSATDPCDLTGLCGESHDVSGFDLTIGGLSFDNNGNSVPEPGDYIQFFQGGIDEVAYYDFALSPERIVAHYEAAGFDLPDLGTWVSADSGNWNTSGNWFQGEIPDTNSEVTILGNAIQQPRSIFKETDVTVKSITFDNSNEYTIGGNGALVLDSDSGTAAVTVLQGSHQIQGATTLSNPTTVTTDPGTTVSFFTLNLGGNTLTKEGDGRMNINNLQNTGGGQVVVNGGTLGGHGEVGGSLTANSGSTVAPGTSAGMLAVETDYTQNAGATLEIEIGGSLAGEEYDVLDVSGTANLAGTLAVSLIGFTPSDGQQFTVLTASSITGGLTVGGPNAGDFTLIPSSTSLVLQFGMGAPLTGDYNNDGVVNAADYVVWRDVLGSTSSLPNDPIGGTIGQDQYNQWRANFGSGSGSGSSSVPEPSGLAFLAIGVAFGSLLKRSRESGRKPNSCDARLN